MSKYKAIVEELARKALNIPEGEVQTLVSKSEEEITEAEVKELGDKLKTRYRDIVSSINKSAELKLEEKFKAGQRTKAEEFEKALKEKFSVESDKTGQELIDDIVEQHNKKASSKGKDITDDDVKRSAAFIRMETEYKNQLKAVKEESDKKINEMTTAQQRKEMFARVSSKALEVFDSMNPVLSEDPKKAASQRNLLVEKLAGYDWEEVDGNFVASKDGKRVENETMHAIGFEDLVKSTASNFFDFRVAQDRKSPNGSDGGNKGDDKDKNKQHSYTGPLPKTQKEYEEAMNSDKLALKDRMAINDHWEKHTAALADK